MEVTNDHFVHAIGQINSSSKRNTDEEPTINE